MSGQKGWQARLSEMGLEAVQEEAGAARGKWGQRGQEAAAERGRKGGWHSGGDEKYSDIHSGCLATGAPTRHKAGGVGIAVRERKIKTHLQKRENCGKIAVP